MDNPAGNPPENAPPGLKRSLGLVSLTVYGVGNMLGAGIYGLVGKTAEVMGNATWMAFAASMVAAALTGLSYASLGSRYPRAAGAAFITQRAFGMAILSYTLGLVVMCSGLTSMATASQVFTRHFSDLVGGLPAPVVIAAFILVLASINFWGIRESAWVNALCTVIEVGGLLLVIAVGMRYWGSINYLDATSVKNPTGDLGPSLILTGSVLTFFSFIGFEDLLNVSEEVKEPRRTFPIALVTALVITTFIYMAVSITAVSVVPHGELAKAQAPLVAVVRTAAPWFPAAAFSAMAMFAVTNTALLNYIMGSRLAYGMSRQGLLPRFMGTLHASRRTPHIAIVIFGLIVLTLALVGDIATLAKSTSLLLLTSFTVVNAALIALKLRKGEEKGGFEVPLFVPLGGIAVCLAMISQADRGPLLTAAAILGGIVTLYAILLPKAVEDTTPYQPHPPEG